jgi:hypothetical protein
VTAEPYTLLHLVCHGQWLRKSGEMLLYLVSSEGRPAGRSRGWDTFTRTTQSVAGVERFAPLCLSGNLRECQS